jgi:hypothetical protein
MTAVVGVAGMEVARVAVEGDVVTTTVTVARPGMKWNRPRA